MWINAVLMGLLYVSFFQLYFLFAENRLLVWLAFFIVVGITIARIPSFKFVRFVPSALLLLLFFFVISYVSVIEIVWLRQFAGIGFSLFVSSLFLVFSDIERFPTRRKSLNTIIILLTVLLILFSSSFFHGLKLFFSARSVLIPLLLSLFHIFLFHLMFSVEVVERRFLIPGLFILFLISFQAFWILEFLPFGPFVLGILHTIPLVVFLQIERDRLLDKQRPQAYLHTVFYSVLIIFLVLIFARWA